MPELLDTGEDLRSAKHVHARVFDLIYTCICMYKH